MIRLWIEKGRVIDLTQINKMWESVVEEGIWTQVAFQVPALGGPYPRTVAERHLYDYPWLGYSGLADSDEARRD